MGRPPRWPARSWIHGRGSGRPAAARRGFTAAAMVASYVAPTAVLLLLVVAYPIAHSFYLSFHETEYLRVKRWVGLRHYAFLVQDPVVWQSIAISVKYVIGSLLGVLPLGLFLAILLNRPLPLMRMFQTICALPWVISQTVTALLWIWLLDPTFSPIYDMLAFTGLPRANIRASTTLALPALIGVNVWMSYPFAMILFLAGLQTIPQEVYEAARIDGASTVGEFRHITLPLLRHTVLATSIMLTLYFFTMVTLVLVFTGGGPGGSTEVLGLRVFNEAFVYWRIGPAAALGVVIFLLNAAFSLVYVRTLGQRSELT